ncbi:MAG TPA: serine hydrolase [Allosphingosinicella sp.]|nr:serine hydrolase [Allosphingosinicella sp.]
MARRSLLIWLAALLWIVPGTAAAQGRLPEPLQRYVEEALRQSETPGVGIAIVNGDDPPIAQGFGVRRMGVAALVDADTLFNIGSLAKSFTAAAAAALVDEGRLGWNDPVVRWLPTMELADPWLTRQITLADLLSHRTGLQAANTAWYRTGIDRAEILRRVRYLEPAAPFRTQQVYNNALYVVAGEVIAAAGGTSWEDVVRSRLLRPLGMTRTIVGMASSTSGNVATPHVVIGGRQQAIRPGDYVSTAPAGGIESTARDMVRWLRFQLGDGSFEGRRVLSGETLQAMHEPWVIIPTTPAMRSARNVRFFGGYGLGWNVMDYYGHKLLWHSGNNDGVMSYMALIPERRLGIVVLQNSWIAQNLRFDLASRILDHYLGLPTRDYAGETLRAARAAQARAAPAPAGPPPAVLPPLELGAYAGLYRSDLYGPVSVTRTARGLVLKLGEGDEAVLTPLSRDTFAVRWRNRIWGEFGDTRVTFALDDSGRPARLSMLVVRDRVEARRVEPAR